MPRFVAHSLAIAFGKREHELVPSPIGLQPGEGSGLLKRLGEVGSRLGTITEIDREAGGMFWVISRLCLALPRAWAGAG